MQRYINYTIDDQNFQGFLALPKSVEKKLPVVLVVHDWSGRNTFAENKARALADLGYIGFAVDMYGEGKIGSTTEEKQALIQPLVSNRALLLKRLLHAVETVKKQPEVDANKIAIIGFCFGGLCALDLARSGEKIAGAISFHGLLHGNGLAEKIIQAKVLVLHGYDDPMVPPAQVMAFADEMTRAKADWQIVMYGHTKHAFTNPQANDANFGTVYEAKADARSWVAMRDFLEEII